MAEMHHSGPNYDDKIQKKNIFERVKNFHADLAWNYPGVDIVDYLIIFTQAPLWEGGQIVLGLEEGGIHMKLVNSK